jgi:hypothetical protein
MHTPIRDAVNVVDTIALEDNPFGESLTMNGDEALLQDWLK